MTETTDVQPVAILGAGLMGAAIAAQYAATGHPVRITTSSSTTASQAEDRVRHHLESDAAEVVWCSTTAEAAQGAAIVVESLPEILDFKQEELRAAQAASPGAILCTNTSSLLIADIAAGLADPAKLVGTHYLNPPAAFPVVELIAGPRTSPAVYAEIDKVLQRIGQTPIRVLKDTTGFVINRLQFAFLREAVSLVDDGVVSAEDLDAVVRDGLARRWSQAGPFTVAAMGGPALFARVAAQVWPHLSNAQAPTDGVARRNFTDEELERTRTRVRTNLLALAAAERAT